MGDQERDEKEVRRASVDPEEAEDTEGHMRRRSREAEEGGSREDEAGESDSDDVEGHMRKK